MQQEPVPSQSHLCHRFNTLIWSFLDAELYKSAIFYAERYFVLDTTNHDARHLYATSLLRSGQPHSAYHFVTQPASIRCSGCLEVKSKCCTALGRHRVAREALEESLKDPAYIHNGPYFNVHFTFSYAGLFPLPHLTRMLFQHREVHGHRPHSLRGLSYTVDQGAWH